MALPKDDANDEQDEEGENDRAEKGDIKYLENIRQKNLPDTSFDDIIGQDEAKVALIQVDLGRFFRIFWYFFSQLFCPSNSLNSSTDWSNGEEFCFTDLLEQEKLHSSNAQLVQRMHRFIQSPARLYYHRI